MNLKKLSSFLLSGLMLVSSIPAGAVRSSDVRPSRSRRSERHLHHRDMGLSGRYKEILDEIYANKDNCEEVAHILFRIINEAERVNGRVEELKSRRASLSRRDRALLEDLLAEQKYVKCVCFVSYMYVVVNTLLTRSRVLCEQSLTEASQGLRALTEVSQGLRALTDISQDLRVLSNTLPLSLRMLTGMSQSLIALKDGIIHFMDNDLPHRSGDGLSSSFKRHAREMLTELASRV